MTAQRSLARFWPLALLVSIAALGVAAQALGWVDWRAWLELARGHAQRWWMPPALVLLQVLLFAFAWPGPAVVWLVAPLYPPLTAVLILTAGGCGGAWAAHTLARGLCGDSLAHLQASRGYRLLQREADFLLLCALRLAPGMPHSVINYASGALRLPLGPYLAAAVVGFGLKSLLYSNVIHGALAADQPADLVSPGAVAALIAGVVAALIARAVVRRRG